MSTHVLEPRRALVPPELAKDIAKRFAQVTVELVVIGVILFVCAGSVWWPRGWLYLGTGLVTTIALASWLLPRNPQVIAERSRLHADTRGFDKVLVLLLTIDTLAIMVVGALDNGRYGWAPLSWGWSIAGAALYLVSLIPTAGAMRVNRRLATTVRVEEQGHELATEGVYRIVRHPFYAGSLLQYPAIALMLGSGWALVGSAAGVVLLVVRTALEDRTLRRELPGYAEYTKRTRYRLVPGIW